MSTATTEESLLPPQMLARLERLELVTRKVFRGRMKGERRSSRKGQSVEFADFRGYVPGDDLRFIDWNLFARLDRLYIKMFLEEEDLHIYLLIDDSPSMRFGTPSKLRTAQQLAAALGYVGLCRGDRVSVQSFTSNRPTVLRGRSSTHRLVGTLQGLSREPPGTPPEPGTAATSLQSSVAKFLSTCRGRGIVVLLTDLMDKGGYEAPLRLLVGHDFDIFLIHILSPEELQPDLRGDLKLVDCEDADEREISVSAGLLKRYQETLQRFISDAKSFCNRRRVHYISARSDQSVDFLVQHYLRSRGLLR